MTRKRKRGDEPWTGSKQPKVAPVSGSREVSSEAGFHAVLSPYYNQVYTLRCFLVDALPSSSRPRKRKIMKHILQDGSNFLDTTLIGVSKNTGPATRQERHLEFVAYTQSQQRLSHGSDGTPEENRIAEIVDFAIWSLLQRRGNAVDGPSHVLCHGAQNSSRQPLVGGKDAVSTEWPTISSYTNDAARRFKRQPWAEILLLLGSHGEAVLCHLLLDCGVFVSLEKGKDNLHQVSGVPISDLLLHRDTPHEPLKTTRSLSSTNAKKDFCAPRSPGAITFVRSRILYARPSLNAQGSVRFGLKHIHVLNRYSDLPDVKQSVHVMKYVFPLQFGLHNVFTWTVDKTETAQEFKDYTLRDQEISLAERRTAQKAGIRRMGNRVNVPKRLRGPPSEMIKAIRKRHSRCSYTQLLRHYCPVREAVSQAWQPLPAAHIQPSSGHLQTHSSSCSALSHTSRCSEQVGDGKRSGSTLRFATPTAQASTFCQAVLKTILPAYSLGSGADGNHNWTVLLSSVDRFVRMRRHESFSLHLVFQRLKILCVSWLQPPTTSPSARLSHSDRAKRIEIFLEFLYYIFDSILIPLIRSHFYVTDSNMHRNQLFYFRHDVWRTVSEPSLIDLRITMFQELGTRDLRLSRRSRLLGHSQLRLLPKKVGVRPILNLRRRAVKNLRGKSFLSQSINSKLMPCFAVLNYEKSLQPQELGSGLFSLGDAHKRLRDFQSLAVETKTDGFYMVKMDVKSCFDTIPQAELVNMVKRLLSEHCYQIDKHAELRAGDGRLPCDQVNKPRRRFLQEARSSKTCPALCGPLLSQLAQKNNRTVFVNLGKTRTWEATTLLKLLQEHVERNVVRIGKRFFQQGQGIPQGSVLSSLLCNFFYGSFENECLGFLRSEASLLLRVIDDFLLITTSKDHACRFAQVMMAGSPKHGIVVHPKKSLANFDLAMNGIKIPRLHGSRMFPYCGVAINVDTLEVGKFRGDKDPDVCNGLTVDFSRRQGVKFRRKVLVSFRIQMMAMMLDTSFSSRSRVSSNLYQMFMETAMKMYRYRKELPKSNRPPDRLVMDTWQELVNLAVTMTRGKRRTKSIDEYECSVSKTQMHWLAAAALDDVIRRKQTRYQTILPWLHGIMERCQAGMQMDTKGLLDIRNTARRTFQRFRY